MPTHIKQEKDDNGGMILRVHGDLLYDDALLLEKLATRARAEFDGEISIDLADLALMDSDAAPVLRRLQTVHDVTIIGTEIFLQTVINSVEGR